MYQYQYQIGVVHRVPNVELRIANCTSQDLGIPLQGRYWLRNEIQDQIERVISASCSATLICVAQRAYGAPRASSREPRTANRASRMCSPVRALVIGHWSSPVTHRPKATGHRPRAIGHWGRVLLVEDFKSLSDPRLCRRPRLPRGLTHSLTHSSKSVVPLRQGRVRGRGSAVGEEWASGRVCECVSECLRG
jgi:hypothetical protein